MTAEPAAQTSAAPYGPRLTRAVGAVVEPDAAATAAGLARQADLIKPPGSLGVLEDLSVQLCGFHRVCPPPVPRHAALAVFAGDHGVVAQGVSPWSPDVTVQQIVNFAAGRTTVATFCAELDVQLCVVDVGVAQPVGDVPGLLRRRVRDGAGDFSQGPAMTRAEALAALEVGVEVADLLVDAGADCLLTGEMGIGNTTPSAALVAVFTGTDPLVVAGRGSGVDEATRRHKGAVVAAALALHRPDPADPVGVLCAVGGLEHAALAGFIVGGVARGVPVVLDGVIADAAALVARALCPAVLQGCVAGHVSAEPASQVSLRALGLAPLVDLGLHLGEGTGAVLAWPILRAALRAMRDMGTFEGDGVSRKDPGLTAGGPAA